MAKSNLVLPLCFNVFNVSIRLLETNFEALKGAKNHKHAEEEGLDPPKKTLLMFNVKSGKEILTPAHRSLSLSSRKKGVAPFLERA